MLLSDNAEVLHGCTHSADAPPAAMRSHHLLRSHGQPRCLCPPPPSPPAPAPQGVPLSSKGQLCCPCRHHASTSRGGLRLSSQGQLYCLCPHPQDVPLLAAVNIAAPPKAAGNVYPDPQLLGAMACTSCYLQAGPWAGRLCLQCPAGQPCWPSCDACSAWDSASVAFNARVQPCWLGCTAGGCGEGWRPKELLCSHSTPQQLPPDIHKASSQPVCGQVWWHFTGVCCTVRSSVAQICIMLQLFWLQAA